MVSERCADRSEAAGEPLAATAVTATTWLLVEMSGTWPRDVAAEGALPEAAQAAVATWLETTPGSRLQFLRRPGRSTAQPVAYVVRSEEDRQEVRRIELEGHEDLASVEIDSAGDSVEGSLVLVCGHGSRDQCCSLRGTAVFGALRDRLDDDELWISSHQGGHRFAANVLVLPAGLQFGRVATSEAAFLTARALGGRIALERYRGRTCYPPVVQAAEHAIRLEAGLDRVGDLSLVGVDEEHVRFRAWDGADWEVVVEHVEGPAVPSSCGEPATPQRSFEARLV